MNVDPDPRRTTRAGHGFETDELGGVRPTARTRQVKTQRLQQAIPNGNRVGFQDRESGVALAPILPQTRLHARVAVR